jgi:DNA-binding transcriptional LysR family regulator
MELLRTEELPLSSFHLGQINFLNVLFEKKNLSETAKALKITQSSATRRLQTVENELGVKLFVRQSRGLKPTVEAQRLIQEIKPHLEKISFALSSLKQKVETISGTIRLGAFTEIGSHLLFPKLLSFRKQNRNVQLVIEYKTELQIQEGLRDGWLDIGMLTKPPDQQNVKMVPFYEEKSVVVTSSNNPNQLYESTSPSFIAYRENDPLTTSFLRAFPKAVKNSKEISFTLFVNSHNCILQALVNSSENEYAVIPKHRAQDLIESGVLKLASPFTLQQKIFLGVSPNSHGLKRTQALLKSLKNLSKL